MSVEKSERLSRLLGKRGIQHAILNAKQHEREAVIVAQAGRLHSVTVATNMAGRGVDIILGGNAEGLASLDTLAEGLLLDTDEGKARFDELFKQYKDECAAEGDKVRALGGLYVLGTERHESRRIDNQLRGRSGRQGDPGESRFYLSLEDELMRLFATGAMSWVMGKALPDDVPIEAKMVTRAIEKAQGTVEARNAEIRKDVLKYDEVMNEQRKVVYRRRQQILDGADLREEALTHLTKVIERQVGVFCSTDYAEDWNLDGLLHDIATYFPTGVHRRRAGRAPRSPGQIRESLLAEAAPLLRAAGGVPRRRHHARDRAPGDALHPRPALAGAPLRDGLPAGGHQPAGHGPEGPPLGVAARGLRHVRPDDRRHLRRLRPLRHAPRGRGRERAPARASSTCSYSGPEDPSSAGRPASSRPRPGRRPPAARRRGAGGGRRRHAHRAPRWCKGEHEKIGRNQPCCCGSGKKFKLCHGK